MSNLLNYILRVLMFATPVIYPVSSLSPALRAGPRLEPAVRPVRRYQAIITGQMPSAGLILQSIVWAIVLFVTGVWVFLRHERSFGLHI